MSNLLESWRAGRLGKTGNQEKVIFSQVQEDASTELHVAKLHNASNIFTIASGGCTALSLLTLEPKALVACDINPAQIALLELKRLALAQDADSALHYFYTNALDLYQNNHSTLDSSVTSYWQNSEKQLSTGLNNLGTIDRRLVQAIKLFYTFIHNKKTVRTMLSFNDLSEQQSYFESIWTNWQWKACFSLAKTLLPIIYSRDILGKLPKDFIEDIKQQVEYTLQATPSVDNSYLWQIFLPTPVPQEKHLPLYLQAELFPKVQRSLATMQCSVDDAVKILKASDRQFDFFALSNILELNTDYAPQLAKAVFEKAESGAAIILRFIFEPQKDKEGGLEPFHKHFTYAADLSEELRQKDRGLFCKHIYVFTKP